MSAGEAGRAGGAESLPSREELELLMNAASEVAQLAGNIALGHFRTSLAVETKGDGSPVTIADRSAERAARDWLARRFPADAVEGEEYATERAGAARRWIVDPIDGTKAFVRGVPLWGTLVAIAYGDTILAGAVAFPATGELIAAAPGCGSWWNGVRCHVSSVSALGESTVLTTDDRFGDRPARGERWRRLAARSTVARTWGDAYGYLLVATGRAEAMVDDIVNPWDVAPLVPIITEAGGRFTSWRGETTAFGGDAIATNGALAQEIRAILMEDGPDA
jgi:histidinol phosphatase-like enzyme (inositol monophosphatase family)